MSVSVPVIGHYHLETTFIGCFTQLLLTLCWASWDQSDIVEIDIPSILQYVSADENHCYNIIQWINEFLEHAWINCEVLYYEDDGQHDIVTIWNSSQIYDPFNVDINSYCSLHWVKNGKVLVCYKKNLFS